MAKRNIKNFDPHKETPVDIPSIKVDNKDKYVDKPVMVKKEIVVEGSKSNLPYTLFHLQKLKQEFGISYEDFLVLIYLQELSIFSLRIQVLDRRIDYGSFLKEGFIEQDYTQSNKNLYRVSDVGNFIIKSFVAMQKDSDAFISENRKTSLDVDSTVSSALSGYFG